MDSSACSIPLCCRFAARAGGRRRSEVSAAVMDNLVRVNDQLYLYHLGHSNTNQLGAEQNNNADKPIADQAGRLSISIFCVNSDVMRRERRRQIPTNVDPPLKSVGGWPAFRHLPTPPDISSMSNSTGDITHRSPRTPRNHQRIQHQQQGQSRDIGRSRRSRPHMIQRARQKYESHRHEGTSAKHTDS
jgi:hypothetical protein